jgi:hypothetical protein
MATTIIAAILLWLMVATTASLQNSPPNKNMTATEVPRFSSSKTPSTVTTTVAFDTPAVIPSWRSTAKPSITTSFENIPTSSIISGASSLLPVLGSGSSFMQLSTGQPVRSERETSPLSPSTHYLAGTENITFLSKMESEPGKLLPALARVRSTTIHHSIFAIMLGTPAQVKTIASPTSFVLAPPASTSSTSSSLLVTTESLTSSPVTTFSSSSSDTSLTSPTTIVPESSETSSTQDAAPTSSKSHSPNEDDHTWPSNFKPFAAVGLLSPVSLTSPAGVLTPIPTQAAASTTVNSDVAAATSTFATIFSAATSASVSPSLTSPLQSVQPSSSPTLSPIVVQPSGHDLNKRLAIGLGIGIPFLCAFLAFIAWWQRTRYVEKKRVDEFERTVEWMTPPGRTTPRSRPRTTPRNTPRRDRTSGTTAAESTATPSTPGPTDLNNLNDVERAVAEDFLKKSAEFESKRASTMSTSQPSPARQQGLDGAHDSPSPRRRPSQVFTRPETASVNLISNAKRIGLTTTVHTRFSPDEIRTALENFQPARLSTVTDVSFGELEMEEPAAAKAFS